MTRRTSPMRHAVAALLVSASLGASCYQPVALSSECKRLISDCLADCPDPPTHPNQGAQHDQRTECERRCHGICSD